MGLDPTAFSDYIVFVDESGDHGLRSIDKDYPVFALSLCVVSKDDYARTVVPSFQAFKFKYWGHDAVILHEHEIRKQRRDFAFLASDRELRSAFMEELTSLVENAPIDIIASVIDKNALRAKYPNPWNPYEIALRFCLERLLRFLLERGQAGRTAHVIFECRGEEEDRALELEFRRICHDNVQFGQVRHDFSQLQLEARFARKSVNSTGLQLADLTARPMGLSVLRPDQRNRAFDAIEGKIYQRKVFP